MSTIYKRPGSPYWWIRWAENGETRRESLKTEDEDEAGILKGEKDKARLFGASGMSSPYLKLDTFLKEYLSHRKKTCRDPKTYEKDKSIIEPFSKAHEGRSLSSIDFKTMESHLTSVAQETSPGNANVHYRHLKTAFNKAVSWRYLPISPFVGLKQFAGTQKTPRFLMGKEVKAFLSSCQEDSYPDAYLMAIIFLYEGPRESEVAILESRHFNLKMGWVSFYGKGHKERQVPLMKEVVEHLAQTDVLKRDGLIFKRGGKAHTRFSVYNIMKRCLVRAGLRDVTVHDLRKTFITHALMSGMEITAVKDSAGHQSIQTTMGYKGLVLEHLKREARKFQFR